MSDTDRTPPSSDADPSHGSARLTVFVLTDYWSGLQEMFEHESFEKMAGVPLVPMLWKALADRGHDVHVFVLGDFSSAKDFSMAGFHVHRLVASPAMRSAVTGPARKRLGKLGSVIAQRIFYRAAMRVAEDRKPDVIYSYRSGPAPAAHWLARRFHAVHITRRWGTFLGQNLFNLPWYKRLKDFGEILSYRIPYDMMIMSNDGTQGDKVAEKLNYPMDKHRFWLDGTAPGIYQPDLDVAAIKQSIGLSASDKMIFGVARLNDWKRFDRAIDAMPTVLQRVSNAHLVIAGDGPLRKSLENQIHRLKLDAHVHLLGSVPNPRVHQLHNAADLFITVQDVTNLGNQIMEAMHSGTCVIAYDMGSVRDVMIDDQTGVLLSHDQLPDLGRYVADLLEDDERRNRLAQGALQFARENIWFWDQRTEAEVQLIYELVEKKRHERPDR